MKGDEVLRLGTPWGKREVLGGGAGASHTGHRLHGSLHAEVWGEPSTGTESRWGTARAGGSARRVAACGHGLSFGGDENVPKSVVLVAAQLGECTKEHRVARWG